MIRVALLSNNRFAAAACLRSLMDMEPGFPPSQITLRGTWPETDLPVLAGIVYQQQEVPFSQTREWNRAAGKGDDVLQLEDDVTFLTPHPLRALAACLAAHKGRAVAQPVIDGERFQNKDLIPQPGRRYRYAATMPLICALHGAAVWTELGGLDERFDSYGCDDNDYCYRARLAGVPLVVLDHVVVRHRTGGSGFRGHRGLGDDMTRSKVKFLQKWGRWPSTLVPYNGAKPPPVPD